MSKIKDDGPAKVEVHPKPRNITRYNNRIKAIVIALVVVAAVIAYYGAKQRSQIPAYTPREDVDLERTNSAFSGGYGDGILAEQPSARTNTVIVDNTRETDASAQANTSDEPEESDFERQLREWRQEQLMLALEAPTQSGGVADFHPDAGGAGSMEATINGMMAESGAGGGMPPGLDLGGLTQRLAMIQQGAAGGGLGGQQAGRRSLYDQDSRFGYLNETVIPPGSEYELVSGSFIPCLMQNAVNSDLAGELVCRVSENVYDSATGRHLLIPMGATLVGAYDANVVFAQERLLVGWHEMNFPDTSKLPLGGMSGVDGLGRAGLTGDVNNHYFKLILGAGIASLVQLPYELSRDDARDGSVESAASQAAGQQVSQVGAEIARRYMEVPPTIESKEGTIHHVFVRKNITFPGPYTAG